MNLKKTFHFFWPHIKPYKWYYLIILLAPVFSSFYPFVYNYTVKILLDLMTSSSGLTYENIIPPVMLFIMAQVVYEGIWRLNNVAEWRSEPYVRSSILLSSYDYIQHHSYRYFQNNFTGTISSKAKGLLDGYDRILGELRLGIFPKILKVTINLMALAFININIGLFLFLWALFYVPFIYKLTTKLNTLAFEESESRHSLMGTVADNISNIISMFAFSARKNELENLKKKVNADFVPKQVKLYKHYFMVQCFSMILYIIMFAFLIIYVINLRMIGVISIGDFAFVFGISMVVAEDVWQATMGLHGFVRALGDFKSAMSILMIPHENTDHVGSEKLSIKQPSIEFRRVKFGYDTRIIFNNLNLNIAAGEKIGLVGQSGAGKSSLVNILLRYFSIEAGQIFIDNQDTAFITQDSIRKNIAIIPQDIMLFHRTLMENIRFGKPGATDNEVIEASKKARIHEYIMQLPEKYNTFVGERGINLSGGQRQRVAIARAILKDAPILILDEATSALDSNTEQQIQQSLEFYIADKQKTVIVIAHRLSTLKHMDRIVVLDDGKIVEQGKHSDLVNTTNSLYNKLWQMQQITEHSVEPIMG